MDVQSQRDDPEALNSRLKGLATAVAALDSHDSATFVTEILALPGEWDGWTRAEALEALLAGGARLDADAALGVLNPTIERARARAYHDQQEAYLLQRCLCILPFVEPCSAGIALTREIVSAVRLAGHELREIVSALGYSRCTEALGLLREFATTAGGRFQSFAAEWIVAIATLGTPEAKQVLLSFVDPDVEQLGLEQYLEHYHRERLASYIADIARSDTAVTDRLYSLCARPLPPAMRIMLAGVIARMERSDAIIAGLELIHDQATPTVPHELLEGLENVFLERRPSGGSGYAHTLEPRSANDIRNRLFAMVLNDNSRIRSAWTLLGQIELWRVEYGRPSSEPRHPAIDSGKLWPPIELVGNIDGVPAGPV